MAKDRDLTAAKTTLKRDELEPGLMKNLQDGRETINCLEVLRWR